ncbi:5-formyltetrahydrofolate cyclo-ligase [Xanthobacteraceae bacterium A53D]
MTPSASTFRAEKARLRTEALVRRGAMGAAARAAASQAAATYAAEALALNMPLAGRIIALFAPFRDEIDTAPLARLLRAAGAELALPVTLALGQPLVFRLWRADDPLSPAGAYAIPTPAEDAPEQVPDDVIVPLAVFDRAGARIGYGAGYYDRTLALLRREKPVRAFGLAFACQETATIPAEPHDEPLDGMITEAGFFSFGGSHAHSLPR